MTIEKVEEMIDHGIREYNCESVPNILIRVYSDHGLKDYFNGYCAAMGIHKSIDGYTVNEKSHFKSKEIITERFPYIALLYEGGVSMRLSYMEMRILLLYGIFFKIDPVFNLLHNSISEEKQITEIEISRLRNISGKTSFKNTCDIESIITDSLEMGLYYKPNDFTYIEAKMEKHRRSMNGMIDEDICKSLIFSRIRGYNWKTRWGTMKSFKRNWPVVVRKASVEYDKLLSSARYL